MTIKQHVMDALKAGHSDIKSIYSHTDTKGVQRTHALSMLSTLHKEGVIEKGYHKTATGGRTRSYKLKEKSE